MANRFKNLLIGLIFFGIIGVTILFIWVLIKFGMIYILVGSLIYFIIYSVGGLIREMGKY